MKSPFPWYGGKRKVASIVWKHFGDVPNYVEPFAGSLAVLLGRPTKPKIETINDIDCFVANFWRALKNDPAGVTKWAKEPINEADLHAKHKWLIKQKNKFTKKMMSDPHYYDVKIAGWWVWGICIWIGDGWCAHDSGKRPALCSGLGINRSTMPKRRKNKSGLQIYLERLSNRLQDVRVICGSWERVLTEVPTTHHGITGIFFDPPYAVERKLDYTCDNLNISHDVRKWCIENGHNPLMKIALCGYEGEHKMPNDWTVIEWESRGTINGAKNQTDAKENAKKERIWFSPHCFTKRKRKGFLY